jgi:hypothetical protein
MRKRKRPALNEQGLTSNFSEKDDSKKQTPNKRPISMPSKYREVILEKMAEKWTNMGLYKSPARAMIAILEGIK